VHYLQIAYWNPKVLCPYKKSARNSL
jgi:hypothetical protein